MNKKDIKIILDNSNFKFRVAGIIENNNKILVTKMRDNTFYCFPGGHVELLEDTFSAAKRELGEELYFDFDLTKLMYIHENFFDHKNKHFHELCFYFKGKPKEKDFVEKDLIWEEIDNGEKLYHDFRWIDLNRIKEYDIRPKQIVEYYLKNKNRFKHFCTRD